MRYYHTLGEKASEELTFEDLEKGEVNKPGIGANKLSGCCRLAVTHEVRYVWIDTCCINKADGEELREAINSMFRWYRDAEVCLVFYNSDWKRLGTKADFCDEIEGITGIPRSVLSGDAKVQDMSVAQRMSWAASRNTTREEDLVYCLLGIFDVVLHMLYGVGLSSVSSAASGNHEQVERRFHPSLGSSHYETTPPHKQQQQQRGASHRAF